MNSNSKLEITEGTWVVDESFYHGSVNSGNKHVAMANFFNAVEPETRVTRTEQRANAHLIAASPELYNSLSSLVAFIEDSAITHPELESWLNKMGDHIKCAHQALNKARGV